MTHPRRKSQQLCKREKSRIQSFHDDNDKHGNAGGGCDNVHLGKAVEEPGVERVAIKYSSKMRELDNKDKRSTHFESFGTSTFPSLNALPQKIERNRED